MSDVLKNMGGPAGEMMDRLADAKTTTDAVDAVEDFANVLMRGAAGAGGPLAVVASRTIGPIIVHQVAVSLVALFRHVGALVPDALADAVEKLEELIKIDLDGDGVVGDDGKRG